MISENPKAIENIRTFYLSEEALNFVKKNLENRPDVNSKTLELIDQSIEKRKSIELKENQSKQGILKNSNGVCSCYNSPREKERSSTRRIYANPNGSLSYRPSSSRSQRYR